MASSNTNGETIETPLLKVGCCSTPSVDPIHVHLTPEAKTLTSVMRDIGVWKMLQNVDSCCPGAV